MHHTWLAAQQRLRLSQASQNCGPPDIVFPHGVVFRAACAHAAGGCALRWASAIDIGFAHFECGIGFHRAFRKARPMSPPSLTASVHCSAMGALCRADSPHLARRHSEHRSARAGLRHAGEYSSIANCAIPSAATAHCKAVQRAADAAKQYLHCPHCAEAWHSGRGRHVCEDWRGRRACQRACAHRRDPLPRAVVCRTHATPMHAG